MNKRKYVYYVGVLTGGACKFVTSVDYVNKTALWESGKKAVEMSMQCADDLVYGLLLNFHYAFTVKVPCGIEFTNGEETANNDL